MLRFIIKLVISLIIITVCTGIGKKWASLSGLIAVMPLTGLIVMLWMYFDYSGDTQTMIDYTKGALWGILPTILFFLTALVCFQKRLSLPVVLAAGFAVWIAAAIVHQSLLK